METVHISITLRVKETYVVEHVMLVNIQNAEKNVCGAFVLIEIR